MSMASQMQSRSTSRQFTDQEMKRYFAKIPGAAIKTIVAGAIVSLIGLAAVQGAPLILVVGIIVVLVGVGIIYLAVGGSKPTDAEYDQWLEEQARIIVGRAGGKLGLDLSQVPGEPLSVHGFILPGTKAAQGYRTDEVCWKTGQDGKVRFSVNVYTFFFPADHHLAVFVSDVNALNQAAYNEKTQEYFYQDIVGATTNDEQDYITIKEKQYRYRIQFFALKINSGDSIGASVGAVPIDNREKIPTFALPNSDVDRTIAQLRTLLRDKKQSKQY